MTIPRTENKGRYALLFQHLDCMIYNPWKQAAEHYTDNVLLSIDTPQLKIIGEEKIMLTLMDLTFLAALTFSVCLFAATR